MTDYKGKVAVITGAANGIGRGLAKSCAAKGLKLALADIDSPNLEALEKELTAQGAEVLTAVFNVADYEAMVVFAQKTFAAYQKVDLFFNNAGVAIVGNIWSISLKDWKWGFDSNVMGLVHGIKAFVPAMLEQETESRIINTASVAGLLISGNSPVYVSSKHAAVALTEVLNLQLQMAGARVRASVLCPGFVVTDLHNADRHRPPELQNDPNDAYYKSEDYLSKEAFMTQSVLGGIPVEQAVEKVWAALEEDKFFIITHPEYKPIIEMRMQNILQEKRPVAL